MELIKNRTELLKILPKNSVGAEIGVFDGSFSKIIKEVVNPRLLHLVDCWEVQPEENYLDARKPHFSTQESFDKAKQQVLDMFKDDKSVGISEMHSDTFFKNVNELLDWVYVDGNHQYHQVLKDLINASKVVKPNGMILGHDFVENAMSQEYGWGVTKAVHDFCHQYGWMIKAITQEQYQDKTKDNFGHPSYALVRCQYGK